MADLTTITNSPPPANAARLPALPAPELSVDYLARVKEIIEVLLGRRGSNWDRAVTFRDLQSSDLGSFMAAGVQVSATRAVYDPGTNQVLPAPDGLADYPEQIRQQLSTALAEVARARRADLNTVEQRLQSVEYSFASRLQETTAAVDRAAAGVRQYNAAYADDLQSMAVQITQLAAAIDNGTSVDIEERFQAIASEIDGLQGQWSLKIQANPAAGQPPVIAGIALSVDSPIAGGGTSSLVFMAEKFGFYTANGTQLPFSIVGNKIVFNGEVYINGTLAIGATGVQPGFEAPNTKNSEAIAATVSVRLTPIGSSVVTGNGIEGSTADSAWAGGGRSAECFAGGAFCAASPLQTGLDMMFGLSSVANVAHYGQLDFGIYLVGSNVRIYESGADLGVTFTTYAANDLFDIKFDKANVFYRKNGAVFHSHAASIASALRFYVGFYSGGKLGGIKIGPMADVSAGVQALTAIPGINTAIADKLSKSTNADLSAQITLKTGGYLLAGTVTDGVYMGPGGLIGVQAGVVKFFVPTSGDPTFAGQLTAAYGTFGAVSIAAGGSFRSGQTAYNTGTGWWMGYSGSTPVMSIGTPGVSSMRWDGAKLILEKPQIEMADRTVAISSPSGTTFNHSRLVTEGYCGAHTASINNPVSPSYSWSISGGTSYASFKLGNTTTAQTTVTVMPKSALAGQAADCVITCSISDGGVTKSVSQVVSVEFT